MKLDPILSPRTGTGDDELVNIIDIGALQELIGDFCAVTGLGAAVVDRQGKILASAGVQEICARYHRVHPETAKNCISAAQRAAGALAERDYVSLTCGNSLHSVATPLFIESMRVGNIVAGPFLYEDEGVNTGSFARQADSCGFAREEYLAALSKVTRLSTERVGNIMAFLAKFSALISRLSFSNVKLARAVAEQERAEAALHESEEKYRSVVENALVGVYIIQDDLVRFANRRWCEMYGYEPDEVVDKLHPKDVVHPDDRELVQENLRKRLSGEEEYIGYEFRCLRKDGRTITVRVFGGTITYRGRRAASGTVTDITREKNLESQLRQAQKMEAIGALAGGVAHDFNNILTTLSGYGTLLLMKLPGSDPLRAYVDEMLSACRKAAGVTHGLLSFSRQEPITLKPINIVDVVKGTEMLLKRLLTEDIVLQTRYFSEELTIMADETQIDQILFNLATNARDAMPAGGLLLIEASLVELNAGSFGIHGPTKTGKYVLLSVSDTGMGMDERTSEKIFEPFFTTKEVGKGTGLGLATVYGIVRQHGGHIAVHSEKNVGTHIRVYFPATDLTAATEEPVQQPVRGGEETILLAEDNDSVRNLIKRVLSEYGYRVLEATDGADALEKFNNSTGISLIIMDSVMPRMNGRAAYDEISRIDPLVKVLFMSGYTRDIILDKGIQDGEFEFVSKPVAPAELLRRVREVLDK